MITRSLKINTKTIIELDEQTYRELLSDTYRISHRNGWGHFIRFNKNRQVFIDNELNKNRRVYSYCPIGDDIVKGFKFSEVLLDCPPEMIELIVDFKYEGIKIKAITQSEFA